MKALKKALIALLGAVLGCCFFVGCLSTKMSVTYVVDGETYRVQEYEMDTQIALPTPPVKEGHTFIGWYTDEALTLPYAEGKITAGLTLYAKFSVSAVYIVVNTDGGEKVEAIEVVPGGDYTVPEAVKEGYTFIGYTYIDENGDEQEFPLTGKYPSNTGIRITAKYEINKYDVTFVADEETTVEVAHGSVAVAPATDKAGYNFEGWYTSATEQTEETKFDLTTAITAETTLYAKYSPKTFTITVNGAQTGYENPQVVYGTAYTLATPDRGANYEFVKFTKGGEDFPATGTYTWTEDIAVDVVWDGVGKDVMFFDGTKELVDIRIETEYDADIAALHLPNVPQKTGYTTDNKWYVDAACTEEFVAEGKVTTDIKLYAKYEAIEYTVTFVVWDKDTKTMKNVSVPVLYGETIANVPQKAERDSYDFKGYFYNGELFDTAAVYTYTTNITVEEKWELKANASLFEYNTSGNYFTERADYDDAWTYVYLAGETYTFADTVTLTMVTAGGDAYATVAGNVLNAKAAGTFVVKVDNNGTVTERSVKVVEYVKSFSLGGTNYDAAWGLNEAGTDYKRNSTDVWQKQVSIDAGELMQVGRANFIPEININAGTLTIDKANVTIKVTVDGEETKDYNVVNGAINFGESLKGKAVAVEIKPSYAVNESHKVVYNVQLNEGTNVYTNDQLKTVYGNTAVSEINLLRNIKAELSADQLNSFTWEGNTYTAPRNGRDAAGNNIGGTGVYERYSGNLKLNGNYFTVDGSSIPLVDCRDGSRDHTVGAYALQNVHFSIFLFGKRETTSYDTCTMENLNVIGNGDMDATAKSGYLIEGKEVLTYSGACIGIQVGSGTLALNNVTSRFGAFAVNAYASDPIKTQDGSGYTHMNKIVATDCKFEKSWANNIYVWGFTSVTLNNCYIGVANGAAIHFDSKAGASEDINVDCELNMTNTDVQNWVIGTEAWFTAYKAQTSVALIRTQVDTAVRLATGGTPVLDGTQVVGATGGAKTVVNSNDKVNFVMLMKTVGENSDWNTDNVGVGTVNLNMTVFDALKFAEDNTEAAKILSQNAKYAQFGADGSELGFGYLRGLVEIIDA